jgi:heptaprenyl diphosphate synthase
MQKKKKDGEKTNRQKTKAMILTALLFAVAIILSIVENQLPPIITFVPGIKFGLSNIVVMFCLFCLSRRQALWLVILKSIFALLTRGFMAGVLSVCGGALSILVMIILIMILKDRISYLMVSICGAVMHNAAQFIAISIFFTNIFFWAYLPILILAGLLAGIVTSVLLRVLLPALRKTII